jgi:hypothetical protein
MPLEEKCSPSAVPARTGRLKLPSGLLFTPGCVLENCIEFDLQPGCWSLTNPKTGTVEQYLVIPKSHTLLLRYHLPESDTRSKPPSTQPE